MSNPSETAADGAGREFIMTHLGLATLPATPDFARANFAAGWTDIIGKWLKEFVEGVARTS